MCGICGVFKKQPLEPSEREVLIPMRDLMIYRGPDDEGMYLEENVGLGVRRLSIIDVQGGHQPLSNEDETVWIAYNGEVYNYRELRSDLTGRGHWFRTTTDTEAIVHLYEECGLDFVHALNGQFAIAIWDRNKQRLILVRDRLGIKPLYYVVTQGGIVFASEIKCLLRWPGVRREVNITLLEEYLFFRYSTGDGTLFKGIYSLLPGHLMICDREGVHIHQYWQIDAEASGTARGNEQGHREHLSGLLYDSVRSRLISDVPVGTMASGGLDSSLITANAAKQHGGLMHTFSVGFHEEEFDETPYARIVAEHCGTKHHEIKVSNKEFADVLPRMIWHNDLPLHHANSVQIYLISKHAKQFVTVLLSGEGADEVFGGYPRFLIPYFYFLNERLPEAVQTLVRHIVENLPGRRIEKLAEALSFDKHMMAIYNSAFVRRAHVQQICSEPLGGDFVYRSAHFRLDGKNNSGEFANELLRLEQQTYLVSLLDRQDRMSLATSIESRVPYLDHRIVEYVNTLPADLKIRWFQSKYLLKKIASGLLPRNIVHRRKRGFENPISHWLKDEDGLGRYLDYLFDDSFFSSGYFKRGNVEKLVRQHVAGIQDHSELLWQLINLAIWQQEFFS